MKILVCVKQSIDTEAVITLSDDATVNREGQTLIIDPYSEFAVERAVQLKEEQGAEVIIVTIGDEGAMAAIRHALSMGADSGILIDDAQIDVDDSSAKAKVLAVAASYVRADLIMGGCKSADTASAQTLPRMAVLMGLPVVNTVTSLDVEGDKIKAARELDDGSAVTEVSLPAIVSAQQGLAEPRYPTVRDIMMSKKKPTVTWSLADMGVDPAQVGTQCSKLKTVDYRLKEERSGGRIIEGELPDAVTETVGLLQTEAKVI